MDPKKPNYPLREVKALLRSGHFFINPNAANTAWNDFNWKRTEIIKCLLKLNDRYHKDDPEKNHFHKKEEHDLYPNTMMDYYKARNIMEGHNVYTHFYIHKGILTISSIKELD